MLADMLVTLAVVAVNVGWNFGEQGDYVPRVEGSIDDFCFHGVCCAVVSFVSLAAIATHDRAPVLCGREARGMSVTSRKCGES